jgi:hypothetical protein
MYNKAWDLLEKADLRSERAREIERFDPARLKTSYVRSQDACDAYASHWSDERKNRWMCHDIAARSVAREAVEAAPSVKVARKLADKARQGSDLRAYAKAVAARIATEAAIFDEAYGRAMPREWWSK